MGRPVQRSAPLDVPAGPAACGLVMGRTGARSALWGTQGAAVADPASLRLSMGVCALHAPGAQYADAGAYTLKFRQLQGKALGAVRNKVQQVLKAAVQQVREGGGGRAGEGGGAAGNGRVAAGETGQ